MVRRENTGSRIVRSRDVAVRYGTVCGLLLLLEMAAFLFMVVVCMMAGHSGSTKMLILLDAFALVPMIGRLLCCLRMAAVCKRDTKSVCAAAERRVDGTVRLEYQVEHRQYYLELREGKQMEAAGMISIRYDEKNPRNVFFGSIFYQKVLLYGLANIGVLALLYTVVNAIFFLFLR